MRVRLLSHFMLTSWMLAVSLFSPAAPMPWWRGCWVPGLVAVGFLVFMLFTSPAPSCGWPTTRPPTNVT